MLRRFHSLLAEPHDTYQQEDVGHLSIISRMRPATQTSLHKHRQTPRPGVAGENTLRHRIASPASCTPRHQPLPPFSRFDHFITMSGHFLFHSLMEWRTKRPRRDTNSKVFCMRLPFLSLSLALGGCGWPHSFPTHSLLPSIPHSLAILFLGLAKRNYISTHKDREKEYLYFLVYF